MFFCWLWKLHIIFTRWGDNEGSECHTTCLKMLWNPPQYIEFRIKMLWNPPQHVVKFDVKRYEIRCKMFGNPPQNVVKSAATKLESQLKRNVIHRVDKTAVTVWQYTSFWPAPWPMESSVPRLCCDESWAWSTPCWCVLLSGYAGAATVPLISTASTQVSHRQTKIEKPWI